METLANRAVGPQLLPATLPPMAGNFPGPSGCLEATQFPGPLPGVLTLRHAEGLPDPSAGRKVLASSSVPRAKGPF